MVAILEVRTYPDPLLQQMSAEVGTLTAEEREFVKDLVHTMYEYDGVGIAAPSTGLGGGADSVF